MYQGLPAGLFSHETGRPTLQRSGAATERSGRDMTENDVRKIVREEIASVLDSEARRVRGITSWERYLQVLLDAARK
jgi:hypothetical protein